jgi:hypothetical protein
MTLGLKLGRRLTAAVAVDGEEVVFQDSRYVARRQEEVEPRLRGYFDRLLEQLRPQAVYFYAPTTAAALTERLAQLLQESADQFAVPAIRLDRSEIRAAVALPGRAARQAVYQELATLWPQVGECRKPQQLPFAEAAVAALIGDVTHALAS